MRITLLGSASALCTAERDNTFMVVEVQSDILLIDCAGSPVKKLLHLGLDFSALDHVFVTHWHPDHTYGLGALLHELLLVGRKRKLHIHLPHSSLGVVKGFLEALFQKLGNMYDIEYHPLHMAEDVLVLERPGYQVYSTPVVHADETLAFKVVEEQDAPSGSKQVACVYSSDTKPCDSLIRFARGADLLIHECTYLDGQEEAIGSTHTTAGQAGRVAAEAHVKKLALVHLGVGPDKDLEAVAGQAQAAYSGPVVIGHDLLSLDV